MNITNSPIIIPAIITIIVTVTFIILWHTDKIDKTIYNPFTIGIICFSTFIICWFIMDTYLYMKQKKEIYDNINKNNINQLESEIKDNRNEYKNEYRKEYKKKSRPLINDNTDNEIHALLSDAEVSTAEIPYKEFKKTKTRDKVNDSIKINNILEQPLNQVPEYRYMTKNQVQVPDDVEIYLDRGKI